MTRTPDKPGLKTTPQTGSGLAPAQPTLRMLLRLAGWGFCAALALGVTVTISQTERGAERIRQAVAGLYEPAADPQKPTARIAETTPDLQAEARRLAQRLETQIQVLAADRDRLASRVAMLERNFDDITGSVKQIATTRITPAVKDGKEAAKEPAREPSAPAGQEAGKEAGKEASKDAEPPPTPAPVATMPAPLPANDNTPARPAPPPPSVAESPSPAPAAPPVRLSALPAIKGTGKETGPAPPDQRSHDQGKDGRKDVVIRQPLPEPAAAAGEPSEALPARLDFGIDLGGASTIEGLRALWASTKAAHAPLLDNLQPAAILRPTGKNGAPQLRLMAGPFADAGAAAAVCRAFAPGRGACRPFAFDGQKLPLR